MCTWVAVKKNMYKSMISFMSHTSRMASELSGIRRALGLTYRSGIWGFPDGNHSPEPTASWGARGATLGNPEKTPT